MFQKLDMNLYGMAFLHYFTEGITCTQALKEEITMYIAATVSSFTQNVKFKVGEQVESFLQFLAFPEVPEK